MGKSSKKRRNGSAKENEEMAIFQFSFRQSKALPFSEAASHNQTSLEN
jgi:hypothetical protein